MKQALTLYPLSNYVVKSKEPQPEQDSTVSARLLRLEEEYKKEQGGGMRKTVEGVLVVHEHGYPHVLLLQVANSFYKLPGDTLPSSHNLELNKDVKAGEQESEEQQLKTGLAKVLDKRLGPEEQNRAQTQDKVDGEKSVMKTLKETEDKGQDGCQWQVGELLAQWWRPNFESFMYPYMPAHITQPKELKSIFVVQLPEHKVLHVPSNMKLVALPLFELYDNAVRYGPSLSAIPHLLSKYQLEFA